MSNRKSANFSTNGFHTAAMVRGSRLEELLGQETLSQMQARMGIEEIAKRIKEEKALKSKVSLLSDKPKGVIAMTVSLYESTASGAREIVVQTNAQSLDVFINGLSDALHSALMSKASASESSAWVIAATLKNAFPVAFAIAGYKAEKVSESKLLTCGVALLDASELLSQSKV